MPYRKRTKVLKRKPRYTRKVKKTFPRYINGNVQTYRVKIQGLFDIANATGAAADIAASVFLNKPGFLWNNAGLVTQTDVGPQYARMLDLFDRFRVNALKVTYLPGYLPNSTSENTLFMVNDYDDYALLSQAKALSSGATIYSRVNGAGARPIKKIFKNPDKRYMNVTLEAALPTDTFTATQTIPVDFFKSMKLVFGQVPANLTVGQICCEWDVSFKGINSNRT